ncbi:hypothetical protein [Aquamicrobium soli]|jgi:hypothetical protein|uniref:Uncharacterized protein n=1 Tax=Aquamicrobium soli TaxID=1811518 RepID=A0ABV7K7I8_9HYPH
MLAHDAVAIPASRACTTPNNHEKAMPITPQGDNEVTAECQYRLHAEGFGRDRARHPTVKERLYEMTEMVDCRISIIQPSTLATELSSTSPISGTV